MPDLKDEKKASESESKKSALSSDNKYRGRRRKNAVDLKCPLCESGIKFISYKDVYQLKKYTSVRGKIIGRDKSGMCAKHQRQLSKAIKKARYMALLSYVSLTK